MSNNIIHESKWAITKRSGNKILKVFLHDSYAKIQKEVTLLKLSTEQEAKLSFDSCAKCWICESEYMVLRPIIGNIELSEFTKQLQELFDVWNNDCRYSGLISDEWSQRVIPWYCMLLQQYIPGSEKLITWLQGSKAEHFIHGDFTLDNIYLSKSNNMIVLDYENATFGPILWDETTLIFSLIERKQFQFAKHLYAEFSCEKEMLQVICAIRLGQSIRKGQNIKLRTEAYEYIFQNFK